MSGDLKHPSKAIPKGTLYGLGLTFFCYTLVILAMAATITRASFYRNVNVIQDVSTQGTPRHGKSANYQVRSTYQVYWSSWASLPHRSFRR